MTTDDSKHLINLLDCRFTTNVVSDSIDIVKSSQASAYRLINVSLLSRNWLLGKRICDEELTTDNSTNYGKQIVKTLSKALTHEFERDSPNATSTRSSNSTGCSQTFRKHCLQNLPRIFGTDLI